MITINEIEKLAEAIKVKYNIEYDFEGIKHIEKIIEIERLYSTGNHRNNSILSFGAFLGQSIILNYGGKWSFDDEWFKVYCIEFNINNRQQKIFPFGKVAKQYQNGTEDSITSFFYIIQIAIND